MSACAARATPSPITSVARWVASASSASEEKTSPPTTSPTSSAALAPSAIHSTRWVRWSASLVTTPSWRPAGATGNLRRDGAPVGPVGCRPVRLAGEIALVTGSTAGIGKAVALQFGAEGALVVVHGRDAERGAAVVAQIVAGGGDADFVAADLGVEESCEELVDTTVARFGSLTVLVNNAVASPDGHDARVGEMDTAYWEHALRVNVTAPMWLARAAIPAFLDAGHGSIVNVSSRQAERPSAGLAAYATSKGGLNALTRAVAVEYAAQGVRCNTISPGYVINERRDATLPAERRARLEAMHLTRLGEARDVAYAAVYLASRESELPDWHQLAARRREQHRARRVVRVTGGPMHPRVSLSAISTFRWTLDEDLAFYEEAGITAIGASLAKLEAAGLEIGAARLRDAGLRVTNLIGIGPFVLDAPAQWPAQRERVGRALDAAEAVDAECLILTTGPAGQLTWEDAADALHDALDPVLADARRRGIPVALEHTNSLRVDVGFVHSLRDVIDLARGLGIGVCVELNACWAERGLASTIREGVDTFRLVQVSDYSVGTLSTPNRLVPGDGDIPLERILGQVLDSGYPGVFDLELIGPRIDEEGYGPAARRALERLDGLLTTLGA